MEYYIASDVGGTQLRAACYPANGTQPVKIRRINTKESQSPVLERLADLIASVWPEDGSVRALGVAAPGPLDPYLGMILEAPNIPDWVNIPLHQFLQDRFHLCTHIGNDANLAALGEWKFGAGRGHHHLVYLTVSTGIGGGVIIDDKVLLGTRGLAAELGHITVLPDGPLCSCGQRGHLEAISSGTAIARWTADQIQSGYTSPFFSSPQPTSLEIAQAARQGDQLAIQAFDRAGTFLGRAVADFLHIFNPTVVIIGGGVSKSGPLLFDPMHKSIKAHVLSEHYLENVSLTTASLGDDAGLMGALALAIEAS